MTELRLHTYGEKLIMSEKVTLASGDINSAALVVECDAVWNGYTGAASALFHTSHDSEPVEVLMNDILEENDDDDGYSSTVTFTCTIPAQVLQKKGILFISIRGISHDGTAALTSSEIQYNIVKGASPGDIALEPTFNMFMQYVAAIEDAISPIDSRMNQKVTVYQRALLADYTAYKADLLESMTGTVVWENPEPSAEFSAQTIALDLSEYRRFVVIANDGTSSAARFATDVHEKGCQYDMWYHFSDATYSRIVTFTDSDVTFSSNSASTSSNNKKNIPVKIIGYKY